MRAYFHNDCGIGLVLVFAQKKEVFTAQLLVILIEYARGRVKHPGLTENQCLYPERIVGMPVDDLKGQIAGKHLKRNAVESKTERTRQDDETRLFPIAGKVAVLLERTRRLLLHAFHSQSLKPILADNPGKRADAGSATYASVLCRKFTVKRGGLHRNRKQQRRHLRPVGTAHARSVVGTHHVEDNGIVGLVGLMSVSEPVGSLDTCISTFPAHWVPSTVIRAFEKSGPASKFCLPGLETCSGRPSVRRKSFPSAAVRHRYWYIISILPQNVFEILAISSRSQDTNLRIPQAIRHIG